MALFTATVMKWQTGKHQDWKRVRDTTNGTSYILNTYRLDSIRAHGTAGTQSSLYYFDNPFNHRDSGCYMEVVKTPAELIAYMDTSQHTHITLPIFPDNDPTNTAVSTTIGTIHFAYAVVHETNSAYSWVTYTDSGLGIHTVLVEYTLAQMIALL
jgi:hypothetical protein